MTSDCVGEWYLGTLRNLTEHVESTCVVMEAFSEKGERQ